MLDQVQRFRLLWRYFGPDWLAYRLGYAVRLRTGQLRRRLPVTAWAELPLRDFLSDPALAEPGAYLDYRRKLAPFFFFRPCDGEHFWSHFDEWDGEGMGHRTGAYPWSLALGPCAQGLGAAQCPRARGGAVPSAIADKVAQGEFRYFESMSVRVGLPPDWHSNPFSGQRASADRHWSQIDDFGCGDIKIIWEPSRFGFTYALVRAYWRTGDERYAELFWQLVESWRLQNPPQQGPNWKCGQEISLRVMAWCFGLYGFLDAAATSARRVATLAQMMAVSGRRIEANLQYALSQRNNHGISEGLGLWTIGVLFPELRLAARWSKKGRQVLEMLGRDLIYNDGSFVQHSVNYHRLMLHDYLWALRLGDLLGEPFSHELKERVGEAGAFLYQIQDEKSGQLSCYGQNDGALILPLSNCDYQDFRPVVQAVHYLYTGTRCYKSGPWDEDLLWLFGLDALDAPVVIPQRTSLQAGVGGYYTLRGPTGFVFTRCATFRHRPGQADMLHVDLWWKGQNVALDAGTYSYNAPEPWNNPLAHTVYHNTVTVDGLDQMERTGKFLWLPWLQSRVYYRQASPARHLLYLEGEHDGYRRLKPPVNHRRGVLHLDEEWWLVVDALNSQGEHRYRLHWLLLDVPYEWTEESGCLTLRTSAGAYYVHMVGLSDNGTYSLVRADAHSPRGWRAPYYYHREPALSVDLVVQTDSTLFWTLFGPEPCDLTRGENMLQVVTQQWQALLHWQMDVASPLITSAALDGAYEDLLVVT